MHTTTISGVSGLPFRIDLTHVEGIDILTDGGNDTLTIFGLDFPGVKRLFADLGSGDDLPIGAKPNLPPGKVPETRIIVDAGPGDDSFMAGPGRGEC